MLGEWQSLATGTSSHLLGEYGNQQSWSLMYNLFADKMLGLNFVAQSVSSNESNQPARPVSFFSIVFRSSTCKHST